MRVFSGRRSAGGIWLPPPRSVNLGDAVAYWKLEEASGNRIDATGRGNDLAPTNAPGNAAGQIGNALAVASASSQFLSRANPPDLRTGGISFTWTAWGLLNSNTAAEYVLVGRFPANGYMFDHVLGSGMRFYFGGSNVTASSVGVWSTGVWHFVVGWYDLAAQSINIQVDNGTIHTVGSVADPADSALPIQIGARGDSTTFWDGKGDEVDFWRRKLNSDERGFLWNAGAGKQPF